MESKDSQDPKKLYWALNEANSWKEVIDGNFHDLGKNTFDQGLHDGEPEPGYL